MNLGLDASLAYNDIANYLDFKAKSYDLREYKITGSITLNNIITYDKNKSFINDINAGFCSPMYVSGVRRGWHLLFLENFRRVMSNKDELLNEIPINLNISCLIEGSIINKMGWFTGSTISTKKEFILDGSEYKVYTLISIEVKLPNGMNGLKITAKSIHSVLEVNSKGYEIINNLNWLNYISLVFQECVERHIKMVEY